MNLNISWGEMYHIVKARFKKAFLLQTLKFEFNSFTGGASPPNCFSFNLRHVVMKLPRPSVSLIRHFEKAFSAFC